MTRINTNVSSLTAQQTLAKSNEQLQTSLTRLSTGLRINSGKDDPAGLIASEMLRSDIVSTQKGISNSQRANQMIATADSAIGQISSLLNDIRGLVTEAANSGAVSSDQITANQLQVDSSLESINRIAGTTAFQGKKLLDGNLAFTTTTSDTDMNYVSDLKINQAILGSGGTQAVTMVATSVGDAATTYSTVGAAGVAAATTFTITAGTMIFTADVTGETYNGVRVKFAKSASVPVGTPIASWDATAKLLTVTTNTADTTVASIKTAVDATPFVLTGTAVAAGSLLAAETPAEQPTTGGSTSGGLADSLVLQISGNVGSQVLKFDSGTTGAVMIAAINSLTNATGVSATYSAVGDPADRLRFNSSTAGTKQFVDIQVLSEGAAGTFKTNLLTTRDAGTDAVATINGYAATADGNTISINVATLSMSATLSATTPEPTTAVFTISGGGALFQLGPDVIASQQVRMGIDAMNTGTLGGTSGKLYQIGSGNTADLDSDPTTAASIVDQAINSVTNLRGRLGAFQKTALQTNINALGDTLTALTDAESSIRDTDFAAETASMTRAQILVQSGTAVLSIANKQPENVLALLR